MFLFILPTHELVEQYNFRIQVLEQVIAFWNIILKACTYKDIVQLLTRTCIDSWKWNEECINLNYNNFTIARIFLFFKKVSVGVEQRESLLKSRLWRTLFELVLVRIVLNLWEYFPTIINMQYTTQYETNMQYNIH